MSGIAIGVPRTLVRRSTCGIATAERGRNATVRDATVTPQRDLAVGAAIDVVEDRTGQAPPGRAPQVFDVDGASRSSGQRHGVIIICPSNGPLLLQTPCISQ